MAFTIPPKGDSLRKARAHFANLEVTAQNTPALTVQVSEGGFWNDDATYIEHTGGTSPALTVPTTNSKLTVVALSLSGTLILIDGTEAVTPDLPAIPSDRIPLAAILLNTTDAVIDDSMIFDIRPLFNIGGDTVDIEASVAANASAIVVLQSDASSLDARVSTMEVSTSANLASQVNRIDASVAANASSIVVLNASTAANTSSIAVLQTTTGDNASSITVLQASAGANASSIVVLNASVAANASAITALQGSVLSGSLWSISASGHLVPTTGSAQDLGSSALPVRSIYMSGSTLFMDGLPVLEKVGGSTISMGAGATGTFNISTHNVAFTGPSGGIMTIAQEIIRSIASPATLAIQARAISLTASGSGGVDIISSGADVNIRAIDASQATIIRVDSLEGSAAASALTHPIQFLVGASTTQIVDASTFGYTITSSGHLIPIVGSAQDFGTAARELRTLHAREWSSSNFTTTASATNISFNGPSGGTMRLHQDSYTYLSNTGASTTPDFIAQGFTFTVGNAQFQVSALGDVYLGGSDITSSARNNLTLNSASNIFVSATNEIIGLPMKLTGFNIGVVATSTIYGMESISTPMTILTQSALTAFAITPDDDGVSFNVKHGGGGSAFSTASVVGTIGFASAATAGSVRFDASVILAVGDFIVVQASVVAGSATSLTDFTWSIVTRSGS